MIFRSHLASLFAAWLVTIVLIVGYDLWLSLRTVALRRRRPRS